MRPRQSLIELFSTFLEFDFDRYQGWAADLRLRHSMERCLTQSVEGTPAKSSDHYWALYWHKVWQAEMAQSNAASRLARGHLTAYVQEPCYWVAQKTAASFSNLQYSLADLFQMAIVQIDKILKGFNAQQGFSLKNYASVTLSNLIRESLRQRQEVDICTDWALLRKLSQKRLVEALQSVGLAAETIASYVLAWNCFKTLYVPKQATGSQKLTKPEPQTWEAITQLYNQERIGQSLAAATPESLEKALAICAKAARTYLYPSMISINTPKPGQDGGEFLDDLAETTHTRSLLADLIAEEEVQQRKTQRQQVNSVLAEAIQQLDEPSQRLIQLYYREGLTQQQMADRMEMKQYTVSRRLTKARESLLLVLAKWSQAALHITPTSDVLNHTSAALEEWLKTHYNHPDLAVDRSCYSLD
jgi:RNA polymerase sigma factor (sigma-70 family)